MPPDDFLTDDYLAELLAQEAADCSIKYSAMGLDAYNRTVKRPANHAKPNTRFLNNIIRGTTSHNRALLAKENADSQARLRELEHAEKQKQHEDQLRLRKLQPGPRDTRKRMLGDIAAIIGGPSKKRKTEDHEDIKHDESERSVRGRENRRDSSPAPKNRNGRKELFGELIADEKKRNASKPTGNRNTRKELFADRHEKTKATSRDASPPHKNRNVRKELFGERDGKRVHTYRRREQQDRSRSRSRDHARHSGRSDSLTREEIDREHRRRASIVESDRRRRRRRSGDLNNNLSKGHTAADKRLDAARAPSSYISSDSDPLEDIIGPAPPKAPAPVRKRGRGATACASGIDSRFAPDYDPKTDVSLDEDDNWGSALEAYRDRAKWRQQGADRLRAAGFTDDAIRKWEKGGQRNEDDVRWSKKGMQREWDLGKDTVVGKLPPQPHPPEKVKTGQEEFKNAWKQVMDNGRL